MMDISVIQKGEDLQIDVEQMGTVEGNPLIDENTHQYIKDYIPVLLAYLWCLKTGVPR